MDTENRRVIKSQREQASRLVTEADWAPQVSQLGPRRVLVGDARIARHLAAVGDALGVEAVLPLSISEAEKTLGKVAEVYAWFGAQGVTRDVVVVALGGGVLTDLVGFAAASYLRGLNWVAVPTSLLGQVDAAIGGKVAVNTAWGKNLVGAFHLPELVVVNSGFLATLPVREWRAGLGEILKSALIRGGWLFERLGSLFLPEGPAQDLGAWEPIIHETAAIKVDLVNQDPFEHGPRMYLNFGHTVGHALENLLGYGALSHGEAVGLGSLVALRLSEEHLGLSPQVRATVLRWMRAWGMPERMPAVDFEALWQQLYRDKKARASGLTWVLLEAVGRPALVRELPRELVERVVEELA